MMEELRFLTTVNSEEVINNIRSDQKHYSLARDIPEMFTILAELSVRQELLQNFNTFHTEIPVIDTAEQCEQWEALISHLLTEFKENRPWSAIKDLYLAACRGYIFRSNGENTVRAMQFVMEFVAYQYGTLNFPHGEEIIIVERMGHGVDVVGYESLGWLGLLPKLKDMLLAMLHRIYNNPMRNPKMCYSDEDFEIVRAAIKAIISDGVLYHQAAADFLPKLSSMASAHKAWLEEIQRDQEVLTKQSITKLFYLAKNQAILDESVRILERTLE